MDTVKVYHYVYRITNVVNSKHYYGKRSSKILPEKDLGVKYFSSSSDKEFIKDQKCNPQNYKYKIVSIYNSSKEAICKEIKLHNKFNVGINCRFYNKARQTAVGFDRAGITVSEKTKELRKGFKHSTETKERIRKSAIGKHMSSTTRDLISKALKGRKHPESAILARTKLANIYDRYTHALLAKAVSITDYAKNNGYNQGNLSSTARADRSQPHHGIINPHYTKGIYARYI